jgi:Copper type II ascorbate-dependent monooxygenase, C-terminal domain
MKSTQLISSSALALALMVGVNACKTTDDSLPTTTERASFDLMQDRILTPTCATSGCHASEQDGSFRQHGLVLAKGVAYDNLINKDPKNQNAIEDKLKRVVPYYSLSSLLYHKLNWNGSQHHSGKDYGSPMPLGSNALSVGQLEFVRRWIEAGSPRTGSVVDSTLLNDKTPSFDTKFEALPPPAAGEGMQMKLNTFSIASNFEREFFQRQAVNNASELYVNRVVVKMRPGSHHFILYSYRDPKATYMPPFNDVRDLRNPDGTTNLLTALSMSNHIFWAGTQTLSYDYVLPQGYALYMPANMSFDLNSHYVNKTSTTTQGEVYANLYTTPKEKVTTVVRALDLANNSISLPPNMKTVMTKSFTFDKKTSVIMLTSHTHKLGEKFVIKIKGGSRDGEVVYETTSWDNPLIKSFTTPLVLNKGEGLTSEITYNNNTAKKVTFGLTSEDEMGIIFGYYYE